MYRLARSSWKYQEPLPLISRLGNVPYNNRNSSGSMKLNLKQVHGICGCGREIYTQYRYALNDTGYSHGTKECHVCDHGCMEFFRYQKPLSDDILGYCCNRNCKLHFQSLEMESCQCSESSTNTDDDT